MRLSHRLDRLEQQRPDERPRFVVNDGHMVTDPTTGERMPAATWRSLHPDAPFFTLQISRADEVDVRAATAEYSGGGRARAARRQGGTLGIDISAARGEARSIGRNQLPGLQLAALQANRGVTLADRAADDAQRAIDLAQRRATADELADQAHANRLNLAKLDLPATI